VRRHDYRASMPQDRSRERLFLLSLAKLLAVLAVAVGAALLLHPLLPSWLTQLVGLALGLAGFYWAMRGTPLDIFRYVGPRDRRDE
jgi:hypothetical protein